VTEPKRKRALITGITGQDGSYLAELLLAKGYEVHGVIRRASTFNTGRIDHIYEDPQAEARRMILHYGDLDDGSALNRILRVSDPDEIYNLGAQSHVKVSFDTPEYTGDVTGLGATRLLEAIRELHTRPRIYQASSSEMFGKVAETPQTETTQFYPRSPYGVAKVYAYWMTVNYREAYGLYAVNGILFNHESPRRGETFVSRKVTRAVGRIRYGLQDKIYLGNLDAKRDWGYAKDYVEAMWLMLQQDEPEDFVIATGHTNTVRRFCELAFARAGITLQWEGEGESEKGLDAASGRTLIELDPRYLRPTEVDLLLGDATKARQKLGWAPRTTFEELVDLMVDADLRLAENEARLKTGAPVDANYR
jgi:GDPmannose 4,6-dehydratase